MMDVVYTDNEKVVRGRMQAGRKIELPLRKKADVVSENVVPVPPRFGLNDLWDIRRRRSFAGTRRRTF